MAKDPKRVAAGKKAAEARYGPPKHVELSDLTPAQRRLVLALVEAQRETNADRAAVRGGPGDSGGDTSDPASEGEGR